MSVNQELYNQLNKELYKIIKASELPKFGKPVTEYEDEHIYFTDLLDLNRRVRFDEMCKIVRTLSARVAVVISNGDTFVATWNKRYEVDEVKDETYEYNAIDIIPFAKIKANYKTFMITVRYKKENFNYSVPTIIDMFKKYFLYTAMEDRPKSMNDKVLNTWQDFIAVNLEEEVKPKRIILDHILNVLAAGNEEYYEYILNSLAWLMQNPGKKIGVALIFTSKQGAGKNILFDWIVRYIYGPRACTVTHLDKLTGKFNSLLLGKSLIVGNEICSDSNNYKVDTNVLKGLITETDTNIEKKGFDAITCKTYCNFIFLSNSKNVLKIEDSDRRYAVFECSDCKIENDKYFTKLGKVLDKEQADKFYTYLLNRDISKFIPRKFPKTEARAQMQTMSNPIKSFVDEGYDWPNGPVQLSDVYIEYKQWCEVYGFKPKNISNFGPEIRALTTATRAGEKKPWMLSAPEGWTPVVDSDEEPKKKSTKDEADAEVEDDDSNAEIKEAPKKRKKSNKEMIKYEVKKSTKV